jgi:Domain of unknown function (DUF4149)
MSVRVKEAGVEISPAREGDGRERRWLPSLVWDLRLLLTALWLGGAVFFSAAVAPAAFGVLRARNIAYAGEAAGAIVSRTLAGLNTSGFILGLLLLTSAFLFRRDVRRRALMLEAVALAVLCLATAVGQWVIAARMQGLRTLMGRPIDDVPVDDPLRLSFNSLHGYSVAALGVAIIAAGVALLLIARRRRGSAAQGRK